MGRARGRQHKLRYELQSVKDKSFENRLRHIVRYQFGVCEAETVTLVDSCLDYLRAALPADRDPLEIFVDIPTGRNIRFKVDPYKAQCTPVKLTPCTDHDLDLWLEQGLIAMQNARLLRMIEQADRAGCSIPLSHLASLVHVSTRTISSRLKPLWKNGFYLPALGVQDSMQGNNCRIARVLHDYLFEQPREQVRKYLFLSPRAYGQILRTGTWIIKLYMSGQTAQELANALKISLLEANSTLSVVREAERFSSSQQKLNSLLEAELGSGYVWKFGKGIQNLQTRSGFEAYLIRRHYFSPARAGLLSDAVESAGQNREGLQRKPGDIVFWAISDKEPAGKERKDCELVAAVLDFYNLEKDRCTRGSSSNLKLQKAIRFATQARKQAGLLCLPDIAFLLGIDIRSLQRAIQKTNIFIPTRGTIMDIGRGVTHRVQIVTLYIQGYTETQIVKRTNHTYDSIAAYIEEFTRVMLLFERGLPPNHIRKVLGRSQKLVNEYISLYHKLNIQENQWKLNLMRQAANEQKKKQGRVI